MYSNYNYVLSICNKLDKIYIEGISLLRPDSTQANTTDFQYIARVQ